MTPGSMPPGAVPERPASTVIATYRNYLDAQRLVDQLSDSGFPVQHVRIVGRGLHSVEQVLTRMTTGKAALAGAASGAWFGLLIGLLLSLFVIGSWWRPLLLGVVLGAVWGAILGATGQAATRGQRDFASARRTEADSYEVEVDDTHAEEALNFAARQRMISGQ
ncbi:general stress protein [Blastococcus sp. Marseille-P5729]|uniref:general stress protein n=1 Tax=Blastococcus sp. Marseille-P5729 TaxID=2086582 RepID=UPI0018FE8351|nr:general stress protein [Blastococcus sp. Marseille-P5729]